MKKLSTYRTLRLARKRLEFLDETANHFNSNNRATNGFSGCLYSHSANGGCAIGRKLSAKLAERLDKELFPQISQIDIRRLPNNLRILGIKFLSDVQDLHDGVFNWDSTGLSSSGKDMYHHIRDKYGLNVVDKQ